MYEATASSGGQYPPIHYQEQPLDGNLNLFPWNSSMKRDPGGRSTKSGLHNVDSAEKAPLLDLRVQTHGHETDR